MIAIDQARALYESDGKDFDARLLDYLRHGIVISSPVSFMMLKIEEHNGVPNWFVECGVGKLHDLISLIDFRRLPEIRFCRLKQGELRAKHYKTDRFVKLSRNGDNK